MSSNSKCPPVPDIDGYLLKLKSKSSIFGSWCKRYFRVNKKNDMFEYFHSKPNLPNPIPSGTIPLKDIENVTDFGNLCFQIQSREVVYMLQAESNAEHACWMKEFQAYLRKRQAFEESQNSWNESKAILCQ